MSGGPGDVPSTAATHRRAVSCVLGLAVLLAPLAAVLAACGDDPASPRAAGPRLVSVLGQGSEHATGFAVAPARVVTVAHALAGGGAVRVRVGGAMRLPVGGAPPVRAGGASRAARVLRVDRRADLALLAVPGLPARAARTASAGDDENAMVLVLRSGHAAALGATVRRAIDARVSAPGAGRPLRRSALELEVRTRAGDSGAPVVTEDGEVTGVVFARSRNEAGTAYAVDARALGDFLAGAGGEGGG